MPEAVVRVLNLDGRWEVTGYDRYPRVLPESIELTYNEWGPDTASFQLHRRPGDLHPDLRAFTEVEVEIGGTLVWSGRVKETPTKGGADAVISVLCEGWQYHLDDDVYERLYVHTRLSDWQDQRTFTDCNLAWFRTAAQVNGEANQIVFGWPNNTSIVGNTDHVGVTLDLGPGRTAAVVVVEWTPISSAAFTAYIVGHSGPYTWSSGYEYTAIGLSGAGRHTASRTMATPRRYVSLAMARSDGATSTVTADHIGTIHRVQVFGATGYVSNLESVLQASDVVKDARAQATRKLSLSDTHVPTFPMTIGTVTYPAFYIPDFTPEGLKTPRENIAAAGAYHDNLQQVNVNREVVFKPKPTAPAFATGPGAVFEDASANSGEDIYNQVIAEGTGPDGARLTVERHAAQQPGAAAVPISTPAFSNPSFNTDTAGWNPDSGVIWTRDTGTFHSSPAAGKLAWPGVLIPGGHVNTTLTGTFLRDVLYLITGYYRGPGGTNLVPMAFRLFAPNMVAQTGVTAGASAWAPFSLAWLPRVDVTGVVFQVGRTNNVFSNNGDVWIDSLQVNQVQGGLLDRYRMTRTKVLPVGGPLTSAAGQQLADAYLQSHMFVPFKGSLRHPGGRALVRHNTGEPVQPHEVGLGIGELVHMGDHVNPDTGGIGRDARIAGVSYNHKDQRAEIAIDNRRGNFEALLARYSAIVGGGQG